MATIILNNKELKAEGVELEVSIAYCVSYLAYIVLFNDAGVVKPVIGPCGLWLAFIGMEA